MTPIEFKISNRSIGPASPTYIIAEIGVNHDGRVERGLELIAAAAEAGVDAVKFQWFEADRLVGDPTAVAAYQRRAQVKDQRAMLRSLEIDAQGMERLIGATHGVGLDAVVTVFSDELVSLAKSLPWDAWKTASPDLVHRPLLAALAEDGRPMLVSTGAADLDGFSRWLDLLRHLILPATCLGLVGAAGTARYLRASLLDVRNARFIMAARARGIPTRRILLVHSLRPALLPVVTLFGLALPILVSGSVVIETIFSWPGMGQVLFNAARARDIPLILGGTLLGTAAVIIGNLVADLLYAVVDPRARRSS